jgi:hypothetical protein
MWYRYRDFFKDVQTVLFSSNFVYFQDLEMDSHCRHMRIFICNPALLPEKLFLPSGNVSLFCFAGEISNSEYELTFLASVGGLGLETYYLRQLRSEEEPSDQLSIATLRLFHTDREPFQVSINILSSVCSSSVASSVVEPEPEPYEPYQ